MTTLRLSHRKNEKCGLKRYVKVVLTLKIKNKTSSNEESINEVH
jgi:hypothetical protein